MGKLNPFSIKKTSNGQTLLHRGNIPLHQGVDGSKEGSTKIETPTENKEVAKKSILDAVPDFSKAKNFNEATMMARQYWQENANTPVGIFKYNGSIMGSALNTPAELQKFNALVKDLKATKEAPFSEYNETYATDTFSGSGIRGETKANAAKRIAMAEQYAKTNQASYNQGASNQEETNSIPSSPTTPVNQYWSDKDERYINYHVNNFTEEAIKNHLVASNKELSPESKLLFNEILKRKEQANLDKWLHNSWDIKKNGADVKNEPKKYKERTWINTANRWGAGIVSGGLFLAGRNRFASGLGNVAGNALIDAVEEYDGYAPRKSDLTGNVQLDDFLIGMGANEVTKQAVRALNNPAVREGIYKVGKFVIKKTAKGLEHVGNQIIGKGGKEEVKNIVKGGKQFIDKTFNTNFDIALPKGTLGGVTQKTVNTIPKPKPTNISTSVPKPNPLVTKIKPNGKTINIAKGNIVDETLFPVIKQGQSHIIVNGVKKLVAFDKNLQKYVILKEGGRLNPFIPKHQNGDIIGTPSWENGYWGANTPTDQIQTNTNEIIEPNNNNRFLMTNRANKPLMNTDMGFSSDKQSVLDAKNYKLPLDQQAMLHGNNAVDSNSNYLKNTGNNQGSSSTSNSFNPLKNMSGSDMLFMGMNTFNTAKGFLGRNQKPPVRSFVDNQDYIGTAKGMNPFVRQQNINDLQASAMMNKPRTIDARVNTAQSLGNQANYNQGVNQINSQDSQMLDQSMNMQNQQRGQELNRMTNNQQNYQRGLQEEAMQNYKAQQAAAQQSINSGMQSYYTMAKDKENQARMKEAQDINLKAGIYGQNTQSVQRDIYSNNPAMPTANGKFAIRVMGADGKMTTQEFNNETEAYNARDASLYNEGINTASKLRTQAQLRDLESFKKGFRRGGKINPFRLEADTAYINQLMQMVRDQNKADNKHRLTVNNPFKSGFGSGFKKRK